MTITTNFAKGTNGTFETMATYLASRQYRAMRTALGEGTLGRSFVVFRATDPKGGEAVIRYALDIWSRSTLNPTYRREMGIEDIPGELYGMGAFAHKFTEIVAEMAEPYLPVFVNHFGQNAWMRDAWEWFASNVVIRTK